MELGDGVDDDTWLFHLQRHEVSQWLREASRTTSWPTKSPRWKTDEADDADASRKEMRKLIEAVYTLPPAPRQRSAASPAVYTPMLEDLARICNPARPTKPNAGWRRRTVEQARFSQSILMDNPHARL